MAAPVQAPAATDTDTGPDQDVVSVQVPNVRALTSVLQCIKAGNKQNCNIAFSADGISVRWEDDSKSLQGSVFLKAELFASLHVPQRRELGLALHTLLDTLSVFATSQAAMVMRFPGPNNELICESVDDSYGLPVSTWARIFSLASEVPHDLDDYWLEPASSFMLQGVLLKEAIDDLEWPGGDVEVTLRRDPPAVSLKAVGNGTLEVELPPSQLTGFRCGGPQLAHAYKHKHLKAACSNLPNPKDGTAVSTKVSIDSNGLLKVAHMLTLGGGPTGRQQALEHASAMLHSQRLDSGKVAVVTFMVQPAEEEGM